MIVRADSGQWGVVEVGGVVEVAEAVGVRVARVARVAVMVVRRAVVVLAVRRRLAGVERVEWVG